LPIPKAIHDVVNQSRILNLCLLKFTLLRHLTPGISGAPTTLMIKGMLGARPLHAVVRRRCHDARPHLTACPSPSSAKSCEAERSGFVRVQLLVESSFSPKAYTR